VKEQAPLPSYKRHRFPPAIIGHAVWLYFRFALSDRDVEELLAERGVVVTYASIRCWCRTFGQSYANGLRRRRPLCWPCSPGLMRECGEEKARSLSGRRGRARIAATASASSAANG